jgi:pimeloyl-ACP methyl ester carboxylesterase
MLDDVGHNPQAEKPGEFARAVMAFSRSLEARVG